ncbi:hypothetical protein GOODEAATRI_030500, partial [Goodea atripinnis]
RTALCLIKPCCLTLTALLLLFNPQSESDSVKVTGTISGLTPGLHGFHVHAFGDNTNGDNNVAKINIADLFLLVTQILEICLFCKIHEKADDLGKGGNEESLKTGNAGGRLACGVIGIAQ